MFFSRVSHNVRLSLTSKWGQKFAAFPMAKIDVFSPFCVEKFNNYILISRDSFQKQFKY